MWTSTETGIFGIIAVLLSALVTNYLNNQGENKRREQDLVRHQFDQDHDHRERLLNARLEAYREFSNRFSEHRRVYKDMHQEWVVYHGWVGKINNPDPFSSEAVLTYADESRQKWTDILPAASAASAALGNALLAMELVASGDVLQKAGELAKLAESSWEALRQFDDANGDGADIQRWTTLGEAEDRLDAGKAILLESIRAELNVETQQDS